MFPSFSLYQNKPQWINGVKAFQNCKISLFKHNPNFQSLISSKDITLCFVRLLFLQIYVFFLSFYILDFFFYLYFVLTPLELLSGWSSIHIAFLLLYTDERGIIFKIVFLEIYWMFPLYKVQFYVLRGNGLSMIFFFSLSL